MWQGYEPNDSLNGGNDSFNVYYECWSVSNDSFNVSNARTSIHNNCLNGSNDSLNVSYKCFNVSNDSSIIHNDSLIRGNDSLNVYYECWSVSNDTFCIPSEEKERSLSSAIFRDSLQRCTQTPFNASHNISTIDFFGLLVRSQIR